MAVGVTLLIIASSFANGISDVLFNKIVVFVAGHVSFSSNEGGSTSKIVFRDRERIEKIINENVPELESLDEAHGVFSRIIGNGVADNMMIIGIDAEKGLSPERQAEFEENFNIIEGEFEDILRTDVENPIIVPVEKAEYLNIKKGDIINARFVNIFGQNQSARFTVVGTMKNDNVFMQSILFVQYKNLKRLLGIKDNESGNYQITIKDPKKNAIIVTDRLHDILKPGPAFISGSIVKSAKTENVTALPFRNTEDAKKLISASFTLSEGKMDDVLKRDGAMVSDVLAKQLHIRVNDKVQISFKPKFSDNSALLPVTVKGIFKSDDVTGKNTVYVHDYLFYKYFNENIPDLVKDKGTAFIPADSASFKKALGDEWVLLPRTKTTDEYTNKVSSIVKLKTKATIIDVNSMYETASQVLQLEFVLNLITFVAVLVLFFIIFIGVVNTLRMTIRERTREIGTIRAIGMQKKDVRRIFVLETGMLAMMSSIAGTIFAFVIMGLLSVISFNTEGNALAILLVKKHLYFMPSAVSVISFMLLIIAVSMITAFFPARRAAKMSSADALRHYE